MSSAAGASELPRICCSTTGSLVAPKATYDYEVLTGDPVALETGIILGRMLF
jgi:hypothetical protein